MIIGVDVGGTYIKSALLDDNGKILKRGREKTEAHEGPLTVIKNIKSSIASVWEAGVVSIGIGMPGLVDMSTGVVRIPPNFKDWDEVNLREPIEDAFKVNVFIGNDANNYALGEWQFGAGRGYENLVVLTLGTGIGGALILNGRLYVGSLYAAAELGHMTIEIDGPQCNCGNRGCVESFIGTPYFLKRAGLLLKKNFSEVKELYDMAVNGNKLALELFKEYGRYLGVAITNYIHIFDPDVVILGGGVSNAFELFKDSMFEEIEKRVMKIPGREANVKRALLGDDAGILGSFFLAKNNGRV